MGSTPLTLNFAPLDAFCAQQPRLSVASEASRNAADGRRVRDMLGSRPGFAIVLAAAAIATDSAVLDRQAVYTRTDGPSTEAKPYQPMKSTRLYIVVWCSDLSTLLMVQRKLDTASR